MLGDSAGKALAVKSERISTGKRLVNTAFEASVVEPLGDWVPLVPQKIPLNDLLLWLRHNDGALSNLLHLELVLADDAVRNDQEEPRRRNTSTNPVLRCRFAVDELKHSVIRSFEIECEDSLLRTDFGYEAVVPLFVVFVRPYGKG